MLGVPETSLNKFVLFYAWQSREQYKLLWVITKVPFILSLCLVLIENNIHSY